MQFNTKLNLRQGTGRRYGPHTHHCHDRHRPPSPPLASLFSPPLFLLPEVPPLLAGAAHGPVRPLGAGAPHVRVSAAWGVVVLKKQARHVCFRCLG